MAFYSLILAEGLKSSRNSAVKSWRLCSVNSYRSELFCYCTLFPVGCILLYSLCTLGHSIIISRQCTLCATVPDFNCLICAVFQDSSEYTFINESALSPIRLTACLWKNKRRANWQLLEFAEAIGFFCVSYFRQF